MFDPKLLDEQVEARVEATREQREHSRALIARGRARYAEEDTGRRARFGARMAARDMPIPEGAESTQGDASDFVDVVFLTLGARAARAVAHVVGDRGRTPLGSGFMISPRLFITNNHVLLDEGAAAGAWLAFNFERGPKLESMEPTVFALRPDLFFHASSWRDLDYAVVAIGERVQGRGSLNDQGFCPLSDRPDKHAKGATVNIVQHPNGRFKQIVLRENRIVGRLETVLHYEADTEGGSSGSPVFNDAWEVVALHHWGKPFRETRTIDGRDVPITVNEGIRVSRIVDELKALAESTIDAGERAYVSEALDASPPDHPQEIGPKTDTRGGAEGSATPPRGEIGMSDADGEAVLVVPLEIRIRIGGHSPVVQKPEPQPATTTPAPETPSPRGPERVVLDRNYENRRGYDPAFLPGLSLPLGPLVAPRAAEIAALKPDQPNAAAGELKYQHFSVVMNAARRLAVLTATNIDGATYVPIDRDTGLPADLGAEGETWYDDPRMEKAHYVGQSFYSANSTVFDRGHLTRRTDPTWGTPDRAVRANADTFHRTNCTPQHWKFNQAVEFWQGIERHYLEFGATLDKSRLTVLQGPVFADLDPPYDDPDGADVPVPLIFWKIVVRVENDLPRATGFLAGHEPLLDIKRPRSTRQREVVEAPKVDAFLATLSSIETATGLDLTALKPFDTFPVGPEWAESNGLMRISDWRDLDS